MKMKTLAASVFAIGMLSAVPVSASAMTVSISPVSQSTTVGGTAAVDIIATLDNDALTSYGLLLNYNSAFIQLTGFTQFLTPFGGASDSFFDALSPSAGIFDFTVLSFLSDSDVDALQGASITLAHLEFKGLAAGTSSLSFDFTDPITYKCVGLNATEIDCGAGQGRITVTGDNGGNDVPEPMSGALVFTALGALALARRYRA